MASIQRLDTTHLSSPDGGFYNTGGSHRGFNASLEKSHSSRDGHEGGRLGTGSLPSGAGSSSHGELPPLTSILSLDTLVLGDHKTSRQVELRRAINAATGAQTEDPILGSIQSKPLGSFGVEDLKRVRASLSENAQRARERIRQLSEAIIKLDRFQITIQSRKRCRPESTSHDRSPAQGPGQRPTGVTHVGKGNLSTVSSTLETPSSQKGGDKAKSGIINKRVRTSLADVRPEGRPSNLSVQRSSGVQDRERDSSKPSSSLTSPVEDKERIHLASEGWEKTKMKGRRSATIKAEAHVVAITNGSTDGDREHKGNAQHHRPSGESRSRPSEGHGFRSGPVNGVTSMQKAESSVQANGLSTRGNKVEPDGALHTGEKGDRPMFAERDRSTSKSGVKSSPGVEAYTAGPAVPTKAKGARGPRSNLVAGANQSVHLSRSSSFTDVREKSSVTALPKPQVLSGSMNRKRPAPSRSSSPPAPSWGSSRPQKMARVARRVNLIPPLSISTPPKEETNVGAEAGTPNHAGGGTASGARSTPPAVAAVSNLARRVTASSTHTLSQSKSRKERSTVSIEPLESEDSGDDSHKPKEKIKKQEGDLLEQKVLGSSVKMASVVLTAKKARVVAEDIGGGDGVRRQGRTGRVSVALRVPAATSPSEKVEVSPLIAKLTRSARAAVEIKPAGPGRPVTKKGTGDRRAATRPRRLLGNGLGELSGEEDDDHEHLVKAVRQTLEFSAAACSNSFWKQVEPYFAHVTSDDLSFLHEQIDLSRGNNTSSPFLKLDTANRSLILANGAVESDGALSLKDLNIFKEQLENGRSLRRGVGGAWRDKDFPLSQRLLSAFIDEGEEDNCLAVSDEAFLDQDLDSPVPLSIHSEGNHDRRDPEGESDGDVVNSELDQWRSSRREGPFSEGSPIINGHVGRLWGDDQAGVDDFFVEHAGKQDGVSGGQMYSKEEEQLSLSGWEAQYQRMSLDDRLLLELQSIGLLPEQPPEHSELEDNEISEELRRLKHQLDQQVCINKEHVTCLENAVLAKKEAEARAREQLAMDKLVEIAFTKRMGGRPSKGAAAKGARVAALAFAKRVLARVQSFDAGHTCVADPALRDLLLCVAPKAVEPACGTTADVDNGADATATGADCTTSNLSPPSKLTVGATLVGFAAAQQTEGKEASERELSEGRPPQSPDRTRSRDEAWPLRTKERELLLEDVAGRTTLMRGVNTLSVNGLGGIKGKRSERDREGKAAHFKDAHTRMVGEVAGRGSGLGTTTTTTTKGERKTKTKPRQKTGPLLKSVKGLAPKPSEQQVFRDRLSSHHTTPHHHASSFMDPLPEPPQNDSEGHIDLSALPLPGMDDMSAPMGGPQQDLGSWLVDFDVEDPLQQTDEFLAGLDVPMDDLSDLGMMM